MRLYTVMSEDDVAVLRQPAVAVQDYGRELQVLSAEMLEFMHQSSGIGLAAPQIGLSKRIVVIQIGDEEGFVLINPSYHFLPHEPIHQTIEEGCLSVPGFSAKVQRYSRILVSAHDPLGGKFQFEASGLLAVCVQHECDHLEGKLFVDYLPRSQQRRFWQEVEKKRLEQQNL